MTRKVPTHLAAQVSARAGMRCEYCYAPQILMGQSFHIDHIIPRSAGGKTIVENLCLACSHCNLAKANRTKAVDPHTGKRVLLFNPRANKWEEHFRWSPNWQKLIGRTSIGRASIATLDMNAQLLQGARPYWRLVGLIP